MKFVKGMVVGGLLTTGIMLTCSDVMDIMNIKKITKKGKKFIKKMGI